MSTPRKHQKVFISFLFSCSVILAVSFECQAQPLIIHEWGTITSQHGQDGYVYGYLNRIRPDETLPDFVHRLDESLLELKSFSKVATVDWNHPPEPHALGVGHPDVTMRLETPVIYFYPQKAFDLSQSIDVSVEFHGGILNEYYPHAKAAYQNLKKREDDPAENYRLTPEAVGSLSWDGLKLGGKWKGPQTVSHVWLAPREVDAADIKTTSGESERYLFYRGVAHLNSLLQTEHSPSSQTLWLYNPKDLLILQYQEIAQQPIPSIRIPCLWVVRVKENGMIGFQELGPLDLSAASKKVLAKISTNFDPEDYSLENLRSLRASMSAELVRAGLFPKEATAMLNTWNSAYFETPGTRIFFIVPRDWIDYYLPLKISVPAKVERVLMGRIDLVGL